jgi:hypothetical protein
MDAEIVPDLAADMVASGKVSLLMTQVRPQWHAKGLVEQVRFHFPIDPSGACRWLLSATIEDLREKVIIASVDIAGETAIAHRLPLVDKPNDVENYPTAKLLNLCYHMGLLTQSQWRRLIWAYDIRHDLERKDSECNVGIEGLIYVFRVCVEAVLSRDPVVLFKVSEIKQIIEAQELTEADGPLEDYESAPDTRQEDIHCDEEVVEDHRRTPDARARFALAAGVLLLCMGFPFVDAFVHDHILTGDWVFVWYLIIIPFLLVGVEVASYIYEEGYIHYKLFGLAAGISFALCLVLTWYAKEEQTLAEHGRIAHCVVDTETTGHHYEVYEWPLALPVDDHVYNLQCPQGGPDRMVTSSDIADKDEPVAVLWDPSQRIHPQPARHLNNYRNLFWLAVGAASAGMLFVLVDALIGARLKRRTELGEDAAGEMLESLIGSAFDLLIRR